MIEYKVTVYFDRTAWYNLDGLLHREDGPATVYADGRKEWWINGKRHREDGPAVEYADGAKTWFLNGKILSEYEFNKRLQSDPCEGKVVEIDGRKYKLTGI